jgi:ribonuclease P protein component
MCSTHYHFGKKKHLKSRKQIDQLFAGGKAFFVHPVKVFWRLEETQTTDEIQLAGRIQNADDGQQTIGEIQLTDDNRKPTDDIQHSTDAFSESKSQNPSSVVGNPSSAISIGVSASKRNFKKAVDRNRVKRLLRETYRLNQHALESAMEGKNASLQVFFIFVDKSIPTFALLQDKMLICLQRLQKIVGETKNEKLL